MMLWVVFGGLLVFTLAALLIALRRAERASDASRAEYEFRVFRAQLDDLKAELDRGAIAPREFEAAKAEIARRLLAADEARRIAPSGPPEWRTGKRTAAVLIAVLPLAAMALYLALGRPDVPSLSHAERVAAEARRQQQLGEIVTALEAKLDAAPDDVSAWVLLGRAEASRGRIAPAVAALARAHALAPRDSAVALLYVNALMEEAGGRVTGEGEAILDSVLVREPDHPGALFFKGLAEAQAGDMQEALARWRRIDESEPPDSPWRRLLAEQRAMVRGAPAR
jgi:cytochrome c-type biogenesis protein CcmH